MYQPPIPMTDIACLRCLILAIPRQIPLECVQRITASDWAARPAPSGPFAQCLDCQAAERLVASGIVADFVAARASVAASRRMEYQYQGASEHARASIIRPGSAGDLDEQLAWMRSVPILAARM